MERRKHRVLGKGLEPRPARHGAVGSQLSFWDIT